MDIATLSLGKLLGDLSTIATSLPVFVFVIIGPHAKIVALIVYFLKTGRRDVRECTCLLFPRGITLNTLVFAVRALEGPDTFTFVASGGDSSGAAYFSRHRGDE